MLKKTKPRWTEPTPLDVKDLPLRPNHNRLKTIIKGNMNKTLLKGSVILTGVVAVVGFILPFFGIDVAVGELVETADGLQGGELLSVVVATALGLLAKLGYDFGKQKLSADPPSTD